MDNSKLQLKKRQELISQISKLISPLTKEEKEEIIGEVFAVKKNGMPISVFKAGLSGLELLTRYLRDVEGRPFKKISEMLNRRLSTIYNTYNHSKMKFKGRLDVSDYSIVIPFTIFKSRKYSVLESIVAELKDRQNLPFTKISSLLNKSYSTIKTVYRRYNLKK